MIRHGGDLRRAARQSGQAQEQLLDFSANINPYGFPDWLRPLISAEVENLTRYPDPQAEGAVAAIAAAHGVAPAEVVVGNGASELLALLPRLLPQRRLLLPVPCYAEYRRAGEQAGLAIEPLPMPEERGFALDLNTLEKALGGAQLVVIGQPNNPTGQLCERDALLRIIREHPQQMFVLDESFIDFCGREDHSLQPQRPANLIIVQSLTKAWAIPGLRLGYAIADEKIAQALREQVPTWSVNGLAQAVAIRAMADHEFIAASRRYVEQRRAELVARLEGLGRLQVLPGAANFVLVKVVDPRLDAATLAGQLLARGILVRQCDNFEGMGKDYLRLAVRTEAEQECLCTALASCLEPSTPRPTRRKTPALMLQGTGSNAGKSVLTAALCRILQQDGLGVAPFKAQNMSLNSCVTFQGGEMGRAQVLQAQACRLDPDVRMNPVLLKPSSATGSQVIVCGKVLETMDFRDYAKRREGIFSQVQQCYDSLASEHQVMLLEGAGSPAEINLKARDIVNMNMARYAKARVLLVGDIDRGGVFASFVGTMELLSEWERQLVEGFVINRFRGDATLLADALDYTSLHTGKSFLGVVPYLSRLGLPEEDSVDFKDGLLETEKPAGDVLDIALIDLPHISNFTDLDALRVEADAHVRKVTSLAELGRPDALILPGSKNVINDLAYLHDSGLGDALCRLATDGKTEIVGICGGYQLLGRRIADPHGIESSGCDCRGLGLLDMETVLERLKTTTSCRATHELSGELLRGYEIHHGSSAGNDLEPLIRRADGTWIGAAAKQRDWIWGTYLHGVFDADGFRRWFLDRLRLRRGWSAIRTVRASYDLEPALDRLAAHVRGALDMERIYRVLGL